MVHYCISAEFQHRAISSTQEAKPKRSKSTEGLASKAQSAESPYEPSADQKSKSTASSTETASGATNTPENVKEFWQKRQSLKSSSPSQSKPSPNQSSTTASKPPLPTSAKSHQKKSTQTSSPKATKSSPRASPQPSSKTKDQTTASPKLWQKRPFSSAKSASPEPAKKSSKKDTNKASRSPKGSPKWSRFSNKGRSKSESPEREPKKAKGTVGHPLEVATSLRSLDRESEGMNETEPQQNVLDIIKHYNKKDEDAKGKPISGKVEVAEASKSSKGGKSASKGNKAEKEKQKHSKEKHTKDEKKESSSHKGWNPFSFFKKKSYTVSEEGATKSSKQKKSKKDGKQVVEDKPEVEQPLTVQSRIKQLMEHGVATDGDEDPDSAGVVLVSVSPYEEELSEDQKVGGDETLPEQEPESKQPEENEDKDDIIIEGSPQEVEKEELAADDTIDRVKKLQSLFQGTTAVRLSFIHSFYVCYMA